MSKYFSGFQTEILYIFPLDTPDLWFQTQRIATEQGRNAKTEENLGALLDPTESTEASPWCWQTSPPGETRPEGRLRLPTEADHGLPCPPEIHQAGLQPTPGPPGA